MVTECECPGPGYCHRHRCEKTTHWYILCQTRPDYFQLWEERRGPGQESVTIKSRKDCRHRGLEVRKHECNSCRGNVQLKVYSCNIHGECTFVNSVPNAHCCLNCTEFEAKEIAKEDDI